jgi:hypothetical protein
MSAIRVPLRSVRLFPAQMASALRGVWKSTSLGELVPSDSFEYSSNNGDANDSAPTRCKECSSVVRLIPIIHTDYGGSDLWDIDLTPVESWDIAPASQP